MVGQLTLDQHIGVRIPGGQPINMRGFAPLPCKLIFCVRTVSVFGGRSRTCLPAVCNAAAGLSATRNLFGDIRRQMCGKRPSTLCDRDSLLPRAALLRRSLLSAAIPRTNAGGLKPEIVARVSAIRPGCYRAMGCQRFCRCRPRPAQNCPEPRLGHFQRANHERAQLAPTEPLTELAPAPIGSKGLIGFVPANYAFSPLALVAC